MPEQNDFDTAFEELAAEIATSAKNAEHLADKVEAMKVLQPYYALRRKVEAKKPQPPRKGTMQSFRERVNGVDDDGGEAEEQSGLRN